MSDPALPMTALVMPERILGKTGEKLPILGLGGAGQTPLSWQGAQDRAIAVIQRAIELGIRYFDTAASYGPSEENLAQVLPTYRNQVFLASKTAARDRDGAWRDLERSLQRLNTPYLDLWQVHHVSYSEELEQLLGPHGAVQALEEAQAQKLIRFRGITGHRDPSVIAAGLQRYPFETALIPINAADCHHPQPFVPHVLPTAQALEVGVIAMKVPAYGRLLKPEILDGMPQALGYVLSQPGVHCCVIAAETVAQLEANVAAAAAFQPLSAAVLTQLEHRTLPVWSETTFFREWS